MDNTRVYCSPSSKFEWDDLSYSSLQNTDGASSRMTKMHEHRDFVERFQIAKNIEASANSNSLRRSAEETREAEVLIHVIFSRGSIKAPRHQI